MTCLNNGMKIFLTGSSGFVGQNLLKKLSTIHEVHQMKSDLLEHKKVQQEGLSVIKLKYYKKYT